MKSKDKATFRRMFLIYQKAVATVSFFYISLFGISQHAKLQQMGKEMTCNCFWKEQTEKKQFSKEQWE